MKERRRKAQLTQSELASRIGLARTSITNIELGQQHIPLHLLYPLAAALGTTPHELLPGGEHTVPKVSETIDPAVAHVIRQAALPRSQRAWIERLVAKVPTTVPITTESSGDSNATSQPRAKGPRAARRTKHR